MNFSDEDVNGVKSLLMSQDSAQQIQALNLLTQAFDKAKDLKRYLFRSLIESFVVDSIGELVGKSDYHLQKEIIKFMNYFLDTELFYTKCGENLLNQIIRVLPFLLNNKANHKMVLSFVNLLSRLFAGFLKFQFTLHSKIAPLLLTILLILKTYRELVGVQICELIKHLFSNIPPENVLEITNNEISLIIKILELLFMTPTSDTFVMGLLCEISVIILNCCPRFDEIRQNSSDQIKIIVSDFIRKHATNFVLCSPYTQSNWILYDAYLMCVHNLFKQESDIINLAEFSKILLDKNILCFLPLRMLHGRNSADKSLSLLSEILIHAAQFEFKLNEMNAFKEDIRVGIQELTKELPMFWPNICLKVAPIQTYHMLILFGYFYSKQKHFNFKTFLTMKHIEFLILNMKVPQDFPQYIIKALWLCFSVAYLIHKNKCKGEVSKVLMELIDRNLLGAFTHHPALLHSTITHPEIPDKLKSNVICLWFNDEGHKQEENCILVNLLATYSPAMEYFVPSLHNNATTEVIGVLWKAIQMQDTLRTNSLCERFFELLPNLIGTKLSHVKNDNSIDIQRILKLACIIFKENVEESTIGVIIMHIAEWFTHDELPIEIITIFLQFLCLSQCDTKEACFTYFNSFFVYRLMKVAFHCNLGKTNIIALKILTNLCSTQITLKLHYDGGNIIKIREFMDLLCSANNASVCQGLKLMQKIIQLSCITDTPIISFHMEYAEISNVLRVLLMKLQMLLGRECVGIEKNCWKCKAAIFEFVDNKYPKTDLSEHVASQMWINIVCSMRMKYPFSTWECKKEKLLFLRAWTRLLRQFNRDQIHEIKPNVIVCYKAEKGFMNETLNLVGKSISNDSLKWDSLQNDVKTLLMETVENFLALDKLLDPKVMELLKKFQTDYFFFKMEIVSLE